jgi:tetratricopeptide (TPR) repeat protein
MLGTMRSIAVVLLLTAPVSAQTAAEAEARRHFDDGSKAYALGEFSRAINEYRAAYNAKPDPAMLYNIAQAYRLAGEVPQALFFYRSYLRQNPKAPNHKDVGKRIRELEQRMPPPEPPPPAAQPPAAQPPAAPHPATPPAAPPQPAQVEARAPLPALSLHVAAAKTPVYKKWWLWTVVGVAAAGVAVGVGLGVQSPLPPSSHFGDTHVF